MDFQNNVKTYGLDDNQIIKRVSIKLSKGVIWDKTVLPAYFGELEDFMDRKNKQAVSVLFISDDDIKPKDIKNGVILQHYICSSTNLPVNNDTELNKISRAEKQDENTEVHKMVIIDQPTGKIQRFEQVFVIAIDEKYARTMAMDQINRSTVKIYKFIMNNFINCKVSLYPLNLMAHIQLKNPIPGLPIFGLCDE